MVSQIKLDYCFFPTFALSKAPHGVPGLVPSTGHVDMELRHVRGVWVHLELKCQWAGVAEGGSEERLGRGVEEVVLFRDGRTAVGVGAGQASCSH